MSDLSPLESALRVSVCSQLCRKQVLEALASVNVEADLCAIQKKSPDIYQRKYGFEPGTTWKSLFINTHASKSSPAKVNYQQHGFANN